MPEHTLPLFFPEALRDYSALTPRLSATSWSLADLAWLHTVDLPSHPQRSSQTPPMTVENILLKVPNEDPIPLAGSFLMHPAPGGNQAVLYTPYGGLERFDDRQTLLNTLSTRLKAPATRNDLLAFLPISRRAALKVDTVLTLTGEVIDGSVFQAQAEILVRSHRANLRVMLEQLEHIPTLAAMLNEVADSMLRRQMPGVAQARTQVSYGSAPANGQTSLTREPLSDALLRSYLHQPRPATRLRHFSNPQLPNAGPEQQRYWALALTQICADLPAMLESPMQSYWRTEVSSGVSRREFFAQAMADKARTDLLLKRQQAIISPEQSQGLHARLGLRGASGSAPDSLGQAQKIRLWETREHYAELAGSMLLIDYQVAYLYTQPKGLQVINSLADLKSNLSALKTYGGLDDPLCNLLTLAERDLLLGFDQFDTSQASLSGPAFTGLIDAIIAKQQDNIRYAVQTWRNSGGAFDLQALFDQAQDVRGMIDSQLLDVAGNGRWPVPTGNANDHRSSIVLAMQAALAIKKLHSVQAALDLKAAAQPASTQAQQRLFLQSIKPDLAQAMAVGIRTEARLRVLDKTLGNDEKAIVDTVLNPDKPVPAQRNNLNGFRPDALSLTLECAQEPNLIPLANCLLLTERGGQDSSTSGRAILWTPALGLESFSSLDKAKEALRQRLQDPVKRLMLLENISRTQYHPHCSYHLGSLRLIARNVLEDRQQSAIDWLLAANAHARSLQRAAGVTVPEQEHYPQVATALSLQRATEIARAIVTRQGLPLWLRTATNDDLQHHIELLEQVRRSTEEGKDYLDDTPLLATRRQRFIRQLPWQVLLYAHMLKLQGKLSNTGYLLLQQVMDMPDAVARASVVGARATIRPLGLVAGPGDAVIEVPGLYLIGEGSSGIQVLYAPYEQELALTEYADEAALLAALALAGPLQSLLLERLQEPDKTTCRNLLASHTARTVHLANQPIQGNVLRRLFDDNHRLLPQLLGSPSKPESLTDWQALGALVAKGLRFAGRFVPGKLAVPLSLWQSYRAFEQSAEALQDHHWKTALSSFINGASQLVELGKVMPDSASGPTPSASADTPEPIDVTAPARTQLQSYEAGDVELNQIGAADAEGRYTAIDTGRRYVPVQGKVYQIEDRAVVPKIVNAEQAGPYLQRDGSQWSLDPDEHSVHFGKAMSRLHNKYKTQVEVRHLINVEARGMDAIRQLYPDRAKQIVQSLELARYYAFNSLYNLGQLGSGQSNSRLEAFIKTFFDVDNVDESLIKRIKHTIVPLCKALVDPSLDQLDHKRFVVGSSHYPAIGVIAFVVTEDELQSVHFTEHFFKQGLDIYEGALTEDFDILGHAQAATLIHEFSHLFSDTWDIATLEARRPFSDLISSVEPQHLELKGQLESFQREALSLATPAEELFAFWNHEENRWEDFDETPGVHRLRSVVRKTTGAIDMAAARTAFLDSTSAQARINTILRNADSLARLICEMGRRLDPESTPSPSNDYQTTA
jgi:hypothetical protein